MVILITGITSGFGQAMARHLSNDGHIVYGTHRHAKEMLPGVNYIKADSSSDEDVKSAVDFVMSKEGKIDVFINNAGMGIGGPLEFSSMEDASKQMDVNFMGMVRYLHQIVPIMRKQGHGRIICISSIGGLVGLPFQGLYSASKFAIEGYCEALRLELRKHNVSVTVIEPGDFQTAFTAQRKSVSSADAAAAYPRYAASLASIEHDENTGLKPDYLARKISRIVMMRKPGYNYIIATPLQKLAVVAKVILPKRLFAVVLSLYYKL